VSTSVPAKKKQRRALPLEHPLERFSVAPDQTVEHFPGRAVEPSLLGLGLVAQQARAHHRRQRQRHDRRDQDRDRERDRELAEQASDHVAHEQQRDQHRDQRERQRNDREADLLGAFSAASSGGSPASM
jgi:hypothetical protein